MRWLQNHYVVLDTDGARAYKAVKIPGVIHDWVVHKKKKIKGKWLKPRYAQLFEHKLPNGKTLATKGGTQIIDRFGGLCGHIWAHEQSGLETLLSNIGLGRRNGRSGIRTKTFG